MRPGGPPSEAGRTSRSARARDARDGAGAQRRTLRQQRCGPPGRAYKGERPTPIFRENGLTKLATVRPPSLHLASGIEAEGRDGPARPSTREPGRAHQVGGAPGRAIWRE